MSTRAGTSRVRLADVALFVLELAVYVAVAWWAYNLVDNVILKAALALVAITVMGLIWARYGSPHARRPVYGVARMALWLLWFGAGVAALWFAELPVLAVVLAVVFLWIFWLQLRPRR